MTGVRVEAAARTRLSALMPYTGLNCNWRVLESRSPVAVVHCGWYNLDYQPLFEPAADGLYFDMGAQRDETPR